MKKSMPLAALMGTTPLAVIVVASSLVAVSTNAEAAPIPAVLVSVINYSCCGYSEYNLSLSTATWTFDAVTGEAAITGGTYIGVVISPAVFGHTMTAVTLGNFVPTLGTWSCQEGTFGNAVGASLCGNYNFGTNKTNQSTYTPTAQGGTVIIGGDDGISGPPQSLQTSYSNMTIRAVYTAEAPSEPGSFKRNYIFSNANASLTSGYSFCFSTTDATTASFPPTKPDCSIGSVVPLPPAVWLFGSALGVMGAMRRKVAS